MTPAGAELQTYVALLRGVNLGARNKVAMADLRALFADLPAHDVSTYVQSGNVVFGSAVSSRAELREAIEQALRRRLGLDVAALLRSRAEVARIVAENPFADGRCEPAALHVTFLADAPARDCLSRLEALRGEGEELRVAGEEVYLHLPDGYGRARLSNAFLERRLGVAATTRNWRTVTRLAELAGA